MPLLERKYENIKEKEVREKYSGMGKESDELLVIIGVDFDTGGWGIKLSEQEWTFGSLFNITGKVAEHVHMFPDARLPHPRLGGGAARDDRLGRVPGHLGPQVLLQRQDSREELETTAE